MASASSTLTVPFFLTVDVHAIEGGGFYGEVRDLAGCLAQADSIEGLAEAVPEDFAEPCV
jgi:predicted RNase H-like HicB family nuclease